MRFRAPVACFAALTVAGLALADDPALVREALDRMETVSAEEWAFTETTVENGSTVVRNHDPSQPDGQRWTVVSVDGSAPDESAGESDVKLDGPGSDGDSEDDEESIGAMITPETLTLLEESSTHAIYSFQPAAEDEDDEKMMAHVDGTLRCEQERALRGVHRAAESQAVLGRFRRQAQGVRNAADLRAGRAAGRPVAPDGPRATGRPGVPGQETRRDRRGHLQRLPPARRLTPPANPTPDLSKKTTEQPNSRKPASRVAGSCTSRRFPP